MDYNPRGLCGIEIITKTLKQMNYDIICFIGHKKNLSKKEIKELIDEFWKVTYYTPDVVKRKTFFFLLHMEYNT